MNKLLAAMFVALLMAGCGGDGKSGSDSSESNQTSAEIPPAKTDSSAEGKPFAIADLSLEMLWVKPGTFEMGSPSSEKDRQDRETSHAVTLTQGFYLGKHTPIEPPSAIGTSSPPAGDPPCVPMQ